MNEYNNCHGWVRLASKEGWFRQRDISRIWQGNKKGIIETKLA
jgi:hypothetical protein